MYRARMYGIQLSPLAAHLVRNGAVTAFPLPYFPMHERWGQGVRWHYDWVAIHNGRAVVAAVQLATAVKQGRGWVWQVAQVAPVPAVSARAYRGLFGFPRALADTLLQYTWGTP